ncbi:MAG: two pore domain potassium channel family protein [Gemmatimonadales bacterium]|nr:MAG: two pore domain potassium channel family protein [Gemmatimonadales bacterium]
MLSLFIGTALILLTVVDALWTTLWVNGGGGPFSSRLAKVLWWALRKCTSEGRSWPLGLAGPVVLVVVFLGWVGLLWAGWTLVFSSDPAAVSYVGSGESPDWTGRAYFTGFTLFTLGIGNIVPQRGGWEIATVVASGSGMLLITLGISYVLSVLGAVVTGRAFAGSVAGLGDDAEGIVLRAWDGERYAGLTLALSTLSSQLETMSQQHLAYPVLHFYHARDANTAPAAAVAVLDEALTVLRFGVPASCRPPESVLEGARASVQNYLSTLKGASVEPADRIPRPPALDRLRTAGLPTVSDAAFARSLEALERRRRTLLGMVETDARTWPPEQS